MYNAYTKSMSTVVPVRVPEGLARKMQKLVDAGLYQSRSGLIREAIRRLIASEGSVAQKAIIVKLVATLVSMIISLEEKSATDVILFGSVARGEAEEESDVDVLVLIESVKGWRVRQRLYDLIYPVILASGVNVSLIIINKESFVSMVEDRDPFALSIINEGVQLYGSFLNEHSKGVP